MSFNSILSSINDVVWGIPTIVLILATGLILSIRLRGIQFTQLGRGFRSIFRKQEGTEGEVSAFAALCTALSATIGTGNIVGVATAIAAGGPGALFWMWIAAILGTATKFTECMLASKFREVKEDGHILGGPFYTIERGMGLYLPVQNIRSLPLSGIRRLHNCNTHNNSTFPCLFIRNIQ